MEISAQILTLVTVLGLLYGLVWIVKRRGGGTIRFGIRGPAGRRIEVVERVGLTPQHSMHLVRADSRFVLVATFPGGMEVITHWQEALEKAGE